MARIGVNALYLIPGGVGGTEIYLRELLKALAELDSQNEYYVFTNMETGADLVPRAANFHWKQQAFHAEFRPGRILWEQIVLPLEAARYRLDVLFSPGFTAPCFAPCALVTTFHDLQHKRHPEYFRWFDLPFWRFLLWASLHRSRKIIAVSHATKADLLDIYSLAEDSIRVIHHGVDPAFFGLDRTKASKLARRFILCVSTLHPHKNIERLIRAFARSRRDRRLTLAGLKGFQTQAIVSLIEQLNVKDDVVITGWLGRKELLELYEGADAFIYPSTFEGFGMPVLEALAAGVPTACSSIAPLREVAGDAAVLFDPSDDQDLLRGLVKITTDETLRKRLAEAGPERARPFTWRRSAEQHLAVFLEAAT